MKLFVILSVIACGYAAKLDRTYLPPASAATAGGSPGALNAPFGGPSGFGQPSRTSPGSSFGPSGSGASGFGKPSEPSGALSGPAGQRTQSGFGQPAPQYGAPAQSQSGVFGQQQGSFGQPQTFGQQSQGPQPVQGSFGQAPSSFGQGSQGAGGFSPETYQQQPERAQSAADRNAEILRYDNQNDGETFSYSFETSNGISAEESGVATNGVQAQGGFSYTGDDGQVYSVQYTADENGYLPRGDHLPTPPPIPEEILRAIEKNAAAAAAGTQEGAYNPDEDNSNSIQQYNAPSFNQQGQAQPGSSAQGQYKQPQAQGPSGFNQPQPQGPSAYNQPQGQGPSTYNQQQEQGPASYNQQGSSRAQGSSRPASGSHQTQAAQGQQPSQYNQGTGAQRPSGSFGQAQGRPQVGGQSQDQSGYQYNRPQSQFGGVPNNQGPANQVQYQSQNAPQGGSQQAPQQYNRPAPSQFSRPSLQSAPSKPSFGSNQGSFGQYNNGPAGPSANGPSNNQIPFGQSPASSQGPRGSQSSQPSRAMPQSAPYQYNRPGTQPSQSGQSGPSQFGQKSAPQQGSNQPGQFPSSRQPPSFSEQDGYKY